MQTRSLAAIATAAALALIGCGAPSVNGSGKPGRPAVLRYCFTVTGEDPGTAGQRLSVVSAYLEKALHMPVEAVQTSGYGAVIEAMRANKVDVASIAPFSYVIASQKTPIEAIVMRGSKDGTPGDYRGAIAVAGNSPIRTIEDLVKHSKELTISFVDPASTSGFLVQNAFLQSRGLDPERDFKKVLFSMNHPASLLTLKAGKVDVAATMERLVVRYEETGKLAKGDVRILWTSPPIPNQPVAIRSDLPAAFKEEVRQAFLSMRTNDPEAWKNLVPKSSQALIAPDSIFVPANDKMFDGLREMAKSVKNLSLLER